jgi:hypothetical protein
VDKQLRKVIAPSGSRKCHQPSTDDAQHPPGRLPIGLGVTEVAHDRLLGSEAFVPRPKRGKLSRVGHHDVARDVFHGLQFVLKMYLL